MPGRAIPLVTGEYYHVFNRGVNKRPIFDSAGSYKRCINQLNYYQHQKTPVKYSTLIKLNQDIRLSIWSSVLKDNQKHVEIVAFCLMPNHFHFLVKQLAEGGISKFMSKFQNSYSRYFNTKIKRTGPLLQGKFKAVRIESDEQLLHVNRYIHLNPLTANLVEEFKELLTYKWSSLPEYLNQSDQNFCKKQIILNFFDSPNKYSNFLSDQTDYQKQLAQLKHLCIE